MSAATEPVRVELIGLAAFGAHGVSDAERQVGRRIVLDISFTVPGCTAVADDRIEGTVDYGAAATLAVGIVTETSCHTLEHLAGLIADRIADSLAATEIEVRAAKSEPPIPEEIVEVAVTVRRPGAE